MGEEDIFEIFHKWTKTLGPKEARIAVFERIRDIPYAVIPELRDPSRGPAGILKLNKGSCQPKHYLLALFFGRLNIPVRYVTYPFKWEGCNIRYPADLRQMAKGLPVAYHLACKAYIDSRWLLVDATWDPPLKRAGFPVNEKWDGVSDTVNAVVPLEEVIHENAQGRVRYEAEKKALYTEREKTSYAEFVEKLNIWLEDTRNKRNP